ncbi:uncharacterized protein DUF2652 [Tenacibaculum adriaticum]|uniref:Uncharacterized protein DUF2652 n=1 Tax=Tenacibaculum adriaticum TaxID=413713 RepID=A0A5S5DS07_9FLAO|nr:DUF2652 domain-containing protein [Tenacibaculum adriaticum]TYP98168.1 uncharacterized protein DUF2652 [Tenacibaculum adriaticum]
MKPKPMLICIPDISGFTEFMSSTDIELSSQVIPALLNKVIYSNTIGLKVSEIEGDAILFYKVGKLPLFKDLIEQCRLFYIEFYKQLKSLNKEFEGKIDELPEVLGLKIILHYGEQISAIPIGKNIKLMGEDVIIAHRLLKNDIPFEEYILMSESVLSQYDHKKIAHNFGWGKLQEMDTRYKYIGDISYKFIDLKPLVN